MLTHLLFQPSQVDLQEHYTMAYRKKNATILAYNPVGDKTYDAGSITYSIFDFNFMPFDIEDAMSDCESEDWGEISFFKWVYSNKCTLEEEIPALDKIILLQELDLNISQVNAKNLELITEGIRNEHNIYHTVALSGTLYPNPKVRMDKIFEELGWDQIHERYWLKL